MPNWNPIQYEKFLKDRTQPAVDLANRLLSVSPESILDLGCGPGNSTKVLKDKFPNAKIIGADNSDEMLAKARELYPDIEFINLDANGDLHEVNEKFDVVFSNARIQWLPNHKELLPKLLTLLNPNGVLAIQIPIQRNHPVHIIINELVQTNKWENKLTPRKYNNLTTEEYYDVLSELSDDFEIWETTYCHRNSYTLCFFDILLRIWKRQISAGNSGFKKLDARFFQCQSTARADVLCLFINICRNTEFNSCHAHF